jgi:extradiol dioxygenase
MAIMKIIALGYVGLESPNAKAWESFGPEVFGFELADPGSSGSVYLRMDDRHHRIAIHSGGQDRLAYLGWELRNDAEYAAAVEELGAAGVQIELGEEEECAERRVEAFTRFRDPAGYVHEIFYGATFTLGSFRPGKAMGGFVAGTDGVGHVVVVVPEITRELEHFATRILGFELFSGAPSAMSKRGGPNPRFYRCNRRTHCFAYIGIPGMQGVQHMCIEANNIDDVGLAYDLVQERNLPVTLSLGRHTMDTLISFYMRTPTGFDIEFGAGGEHLSDDFVQQYPSNSEVWGHKPVTRGWAPTVRPMKE